MGVRLSSTTEARSLSFTMSASKPSVVKVLGLGNPLLDISAEMPAETLTKYKLKPANAVLAEEHHMPLYDELCALPEVEYIPGGSCLNTMRMFQYLHSAPHHASYMGCIGKDEHGKRLKEQTDKDGVFTHFMV